MILYKEEILNTFGSRMKRRDKINFINFIKKELMKRCIYLKEDKDKFYKNYYVGNIDTAKYIIGAHYDTPPRMPSILMKSVLFMNILINLPLIMIFTKYYIIGILISTISYLYVLGFLGNANKYNYNDNSSGVLTVLNLMINLKEKKENLDEYLFVFFDNEEKGLFGSLFFNKKYFNKLRNKKTIIVDCVSNGEYINLYDSKKEVSFFTKKLCYCFSKYKSNYFKKNFLKQSDHVTFKNDSCLITTENINKRKNKFFMPFIHTKKDKVFDDEIVEYIIYELGRFLE